MLLIKLLRSRVAIGLALAWVVAGCSTNAGFGTPASNPAPVYNGYPYNPAASPQPSGSVVLQGGLAEPGAPEAGGLGASPQPSATPVPNTLSIVGAALRLAYDGSAKDPVKAPRLLMLSFALQNTTRTAAKVASVTAYADKTALGDSAVSLSAPANQLSEVAAVALKTTDELGKYKQVTVNFLDDTKKMIASLKLDVPQPDSSYTALDEKHPKGVFSVDSVEIARVEAGQGQHFECTFALTNAGATQVAISEFNIAPPKGDPVKLAIPQIVPPRSVSSFMSIVVPYSGKALPAGSYVMSAMQNGKTAAKASAILL